MCDGRDGDEVCVLGLERGGEYERDVLGVEGRDVGELGRGADVLCDGADGARWVLALGVECFGVELRTAPAGVFRVACGVE